MGTERQSVSGPADPWLHRTVGGHYRIDARIGAGAMGTVYRAHHTLLDQDFALKILSEGISRDPEVRRRFLVEARSLALFTQKNAVQVRHCGEEDGALYLAMDLVRGETLESVIGREGPLALPRAAAIAVAILEALAEAHAAGIVHRDVKPANVMIESLPGPGGGAPTDRVKVLDFGLARIVDVEGAALPSAFASLGGSVVGTVAYMSPEQLRSDDVDGRGDLFAVGAVLYEMLSGRLPFAGASTMSIALRIVEGEPDPWPQDVGSTLPPAVAAVVSRALEKDPARRFATAAEMAAAVKAAVGGVAPPPLPPLPSSVAQRNGAASHAPPEHRGKRLLIAGVLLATLLGGVFLLPRLVKAPLDDPGASARERAAVAAAEGRFSTAVDAWSEAIAARAGDGLAWLGRGDARTSLGDRNGRADLDEAVRLLPEDPRPFVARARYLWRVESDSTGADADLSQAVSRDPANLEARAERVEMNLARGEFGRAQDDVESLERSAPNDARTLLLRGTLSWRRAAKAEGPAKREAYDRAEEAAKKAEEADPRWSEAFALHAVAVQERGTLSRQEGNYEAARADFAASETSWTEALRLARDLPAHRGQGASVARRYRDRAGIRFLNENEAGAFEDLAAQLALAPRDPVGLSMRGYALQQLGRHEEAIKDFERLSDVTGDPEYLFRQAFSWQRIGDDRADHGNEEAAAEAYGKALSRYDAAVDRAPKFPSYRAYRGEARTLLAAVQRGDERAASLAAAKKDFDEALAAAPQEGEILLRRCEWALEGERWAEAVADVRAAIGTRLDRTPRYYLRAAQACLSLARVEVKAGRKPEAWALANESFGAASRAYDLMPGLGPTALSLRAAALAVGAAAAEGETRTQAIEAAKNDLEEAERLAKGPDEAAVRARATVDYVRADVLRVEGDAAGAVSAAAEAVSVRQEAHEAGRWSLDRRWYERLAEILEAQGDERAKPFREAADKLRR